MINRIKIKDIGEVISGSTPKTNIKEYWNGNNNWITPAELTDKSYLINETERKITDLAIEKTSLKKLPKGTVLLTSRAPIGKVAIANTDMYCNQGFKNIVCNEKIYNKFLYYFLKSKTDYLNSLGRGATFKEISKSIVESIEIPCYSIEEQKEIVKKFEKVQKLIDIQENQIIDLNKSKKAYFTKLFGTPLLNEMKWNVIKTIECCEKITDGSHFSPKDVFEGYPMLSVKDMRNDGFHYDECKYVSTEDFEILKKQGCVPKKDDVLIAKDGSYFYYGFTVKEDKEEAVLSSIAILRPNINMVNPEYLCNYMLSNEIVNLVGSNYVTGVALKRVILKGIKDIPIMLPPIEIQNKFAKFTKKIDENTKDSEEKIEQLKIIQEGLMNKYFN